MGELDCLRLFCVGVLILSLLSLDRDRSLFLTGDLEWDLERSCLGDLALSLLIGDFLRYFSGDFDFLLLGECDDFLFCVECDLSCLLSRDCFSSGVCDLADLWRLLDELCNSLGGELDFFLDEGGELENFLRGGEADLDCDLPLTPRSLVLEGG